jgi:hypothetical protein
MGAGTFLRMPAPHAQDKQIPTVEQVKMENKFTHRQNSVSSYTSICLKCFRVVATRDRESELRGYEAIHSCSQAKPDPTCWEILCRTCEELVAFGTTPAHNSGPGAEGSRPGTIRCTRGHTHIYFSRNFCLYLSPVKIADTTMQDNVRIYKAINPFWESSCSPLPLKPPNSQHESEISAEGFDSYAESLLAETPRKTAKDARPERPVGRLGTEENARTSIGGRHASQALTD